MGRGYDVVQMPAGIEQSELPETMVVGVPFVVRGERYVLGLGSHDRLAVCEEADGGTTAPEDCYCYYIIRRADVRGPAA